MSQGLQVQEAKLADDVFYRHWPVEAPRAAAILVHGLGEHSGRYQHVAEALSARGVACWAPDHLGHGKSPGHRCHIGDFASYYAPLDALRDLIETAMPGLPCFLIGHSMGGLIAGNYILDRQVRFAGVAFSGAAFEVAEPPSGFAIFINKLIAAVMPKLGVLQLDPSEVSRDADVVMRYREDPLVHDGKVSAKLAVELFGAMDALAARRSAISLPVLIMHGEGDVMTAPVGAKHFFESVGSEDKTLRLYPGLYHEIFNEPEQDQVLGELGDWLAAHVSGEEPDEGSTDAAQYAG